MNLIEIGTKYGALGVICVWLGVTNIRLSKVEDRLIDCQEQVILEIKNKINSSIILPKKLFAILPKKTKISYENI